MKSIQVYVETWRKLKQAALDRDTSILEIVKNLVDNYL